VASDTAVESNEAFTVTLSDPSAGAVIDTASATGVIRNDDTSLSIAATSADKAEGDLGATAFTFTVTRAGDLSGIASASWAVTDDGTIDSDFIPTADLLESADLLSYIASSVDLFFPGVSLFGGLLPSGTVSFAAGESSKIVTVWTLGETVLEGDESFAVTLSDASEGTVIDTSSAVGTIRNDDGPPAGLVSISDVTVTEGDDETQLATFTVTRTGGTSAFNVDYATADGTAMVADGDYAATSGTLHFDDGVDVQTFSVLVNGDSVFESDEAFFVDLSGATHGAVLGIGTGVGTILNDDIAPGPTTLMGTPGDDNLNGGPGDDIIIGLAGSDILGGGAGNDSLDGGPGTDLLIGGAGADTFIGGDGDDYLLIDSEDTAIDGGAGFDSAFVLTGDPVTLDMGAASIEWALGDAGADTFNAATQTGGVYIYGMEGDDTLTGSAFGDYLDGGNGNDTLAGGGGDDLLVGNGGTDILRGQGGDDYLIELGGDSQIDGGAGFDSLFVWSDTGVTLNLTTASIEWVQGSVLGDDNLNAAGNTVNTFLYGWGGNDTLTAGSADDYIAGGAGDDILTGGAGNDTLIGETGFDRYVYTAAVWGSDTIHSFDFNGEKLDFTAVASIDSFADFTAYEWDPLGLGYNSTTLFYTDGGTTSAITLIGVQTASLSDADFLFA
ncbi:MAG: Calx-beta domain-containing protein, partial [Reyranella sp.]|nr:Calx-beta domain-containing protein [Reyranella sp.]